MAAWPLIPLGLLIGVAAVEELAGDDDATTDDRRQERAESASSSVVRSSVVPRLAVALLAAITLAALPVAYYPALTLWAPLAAGLALAILIEQARPPPPLPLRQARGSTATLRAPAARRPWRWRHSLRSFPRRRSSITGTASPTATTSS